MFQINDPLVREQYRNCDNYLVEYDERGDRSVCAIYFSSHNIYYPNTHRAFSKAILTQDHFEWYKTRLNIAYKHIFLRDIHKQWYVNGISKTHDSIDATAVLLRELTHGYRTIWIGSSAGGYAATLFGNLLKGERVFSFNGQMEIESLLEVSSPDVDPLVFKYQNDPPKAKYYCLRPHLSNSENTYYFCSQKSAWDAAQLDHIKGLGVNVLRFSSRKHGIPFMKSSLLDVIQLGTADLARYLGRTNDPLWFSLQISGFAKTGKGLVQTGRKVPELLLRRVLRAK